MMVDDLSLLSREQKNALRPFLRCIGCIPGDPPTLTVERRYRDEITNADFLALNAAFRRNVLFSDVYGKPKLREE